MSLFSRTISSVTQLPIVTKAVTGTTPGRAVAERFVAGDDLSEAVEVARTLNGAGLTVSLDLLGEEVRDLGAAKSAREAYLESIDHIASAGIAGNISIKLTQLGLALDRDLVVESLDALAGRASAAGTTVTVDMESSEFTEATVDVYAQAQERHGNLGIALQAYLRRTPADLERLLPLGGHIRLCKGAYVEPASIAFTSGGEVDAAFARLLEPLMADDRVVPAIATHDDDLIELAIRHSQQRSRPWEMQMLYGVRPDLQTSLVDRGVPMRVYVPFGSEWYAYLTRRLAERPANLAFFARALVGRG